MELVMPCHDGYHQPGNGYRLAFLNLADIVVFDITAIDDGDGIGADGSYHLSLRHHDPGIFTQPDTMMTGWVAIASAGSANAPGYRNAAAMIFNFF